MNSQEIAKIAHKAHRAYCKSIGHKTQPKWKDLTEDHKSVITTSVYMIKKGAIKTQQQSHNRFVKSKIANGWKYGQEYCPKKKTNPRLVGFKDLSLEDRTKEMIFFTVVKNNI